MKDDIKELKAFIEQVVVILPQVIRGMLRMQSNALVQGKITPAQYFVLDAINAQGALSMGQLAAELSVSLPAMSGIVNRLFNLKLVKRIYPVKDRRIIKIDITPRAKNLVKTIYAQRREAFEKVFGQLSGQDRAQYLHVVNKMHNILYKGRDIKYQG